MSEDEVQPDEHITHFQVTYSRVWTWTGCCEEAGKVEKYDCTVIEARSQGSS